MNELNAAVNINPQSRTVNKNKRKLNVIRLGTSGSLQKNIEVNQLVASSHGLGLDGLLPYYAGWQKHNHYDLVSAFKTHCNWSNYLPHPYCIAASKKLLKTLASDLTQGVTATAPGFYAPQGRELTLKSSTKNLNQLISSFKFQSHCITNFEMETSALYGLGKLLHHECLTICVIIANRVTKQFSTDMNKSVKYLIENTLEKISNTK
jgi:uridine phosphorylase